MTSSFYLPRETPGEIMSWKFLVIILLLFSGCIQGNVTLLDASKNYPPSANIEILKEKPARPFKTIAIVKATGLPGSGDPELLAVLRGQAKAVGADAIMPLPKEENDSVDVYNPCTGGIVCGGPQKTIVWKALAIKYE
jgi:hypothetical protein